MSDVQQKPSTLGKSDPTKDLEKASLDTVYATLGTSPKGLTSGEAAICSSSSL